MSEEFKIMSVAELRKFAKDNGDEYVRKQTELELTKIMECVKRAAALDIPAELEYPYYSLPKAVWDSVRSKLSDGGYQTYVRKIDAKTLCLTIDWE